MIREQEKDRLVPVSIELVLKLHSKIVYVPYCINLTPLQYFRLLKPYPQVTWVLIIAR